MKCLSASGNEISIPSISIRNITCYNIDSEETYMKTSELIKLLKKAGCRLERSGANHDIWYSPITNKKFEVPRHGAKELKTGLAYGILKQAGLK